MKKSLGLDISPPAGACTDTACPWHGSLPVRGRTMAGMVTSAKPQHTALVEASSNKFIRKFEAYERRTIRIAAHNPECMKAKEGDTVIIAECRPLSKTKSFVVVEVVQNKETKEE